MSCRSALTSAAVAGVLIFMSAAGAFAVASPVTVTLHKSDLPAGYRLYIAKTWSNAEIAAHYHMTTAEFDRHGRITGLIETFRGSNPRLPTSIFTDVHVFKSAAGATWDWVRAAKHDLAVTRRVAVPRVGVACFAFVEAYAANNLKLDIFNVDFHRGNYDVSVGVAGATGYVHVTDALRYARIVDGHIRSAK